MFKTKSEQALSELNALKANAQQTIDELERKHKIEVRPVFRLECA